MASQDSAFLRLPSELKLQTCEYLRAGEIVRLRLLCKSIQKFVDINAEHISSVIRTRELHRLKAFIAYYVTYEDNVSFLEAFSRWSRLRGWAANAAGPNTYANITSIQAFARHWAPLKMYPDLSTETQRTIFSIAEYMYEIDRKIIKDYGSIDLDDFLHNFQLLAKNAPGFTKETAAAIHAELLFAPGRRLDGPERKAYNMEDRRTVFEDPIFAPMKSTGLAREINPISYTRWMEPKLAVDIFGAPRLPWTNQFTYCVEHDWAHYTINDINRMYSQKQPIPPLLLAAGMEELRIN